ncbi:integrase catalytic domain-containing protein [Trichonephila clavipes]|nr:integrase catalytic domain-containing protein [Trichonephila clavipes]
MEYWITFKELFQATVIDNSDLTEIDKLQYLFASVKDLLEGMPIFGPAGTPTAIPTKLGYILSGKIYAPPLKESIVNSSLNDQLSELWKLEEVPKTNAKIQIPDPCEESFSKSVKRNNEGRYIVNLPFKESNTLGESKEKAVQLLYALENKFHKNKQFKDNFLNFMNEYLALGHMREISQKWDDETPNCYIPYHMSFELQTITYGTSCAPFLALRTLQQLYQDEEQNFPLAAKIARENIYIDDLLLGADTEVEAKSIIIEIQNLLKSGGFILRKWSSSQPKVLQDLDTSLLASKPLHSLGDEESKQRVLGLIWNLKTDSIQVKVVHEEIVKTKRQLLSVIAQIFDPLGLFSPSVITLKIMLQELWKSKAFWDDPIPSSILENWNKFTKENWINNDLKEELASAKILTTCKVEADSVLNSIPLVVKSNPLEPIISKFSNFTKLIRVIALCKRFINNCKSGSKVKGQLKSEEVESAHKFLVKTIQQAEYSQEISHLKYHKPIPRSSKLLSLNIFLDEDEILWVGDLPKQRITQTRPFEIVGIDFAGPILTKCQHLRKANKFKSYICLFICLATKEVHLELVSTLSTDAMLAALRRFIARRGHPSEIHSDNGTNFIGANNYLKQLYMLVKEHSIQKYSTDRNIRWKFIPPYAPNFGGLWESSIKLAKRHLIKTCKGHLLSFEELSTLLCQIEACINSRPLVPLSSDPADIRALTPGHFLIGEPLLEIPESKSITNTSLSLSCRWKSLLKLRQHFWDRWHKEVLHHYQSRPKWKASQSEVQVGNLVLISDDNIPPLSWPMARILKLIPGTDGTNRVAILQTGSGLTRRSINKIVVLPVCAQEDGDSEIHH